MPAFHVARSIVIDVPIQIVRESLIDYRQWPIWSPWLITEPETKVNFSAEQSKAGASYDWSGDLTGKGEMTLKTIADKKLEMDLQFLIPFKSFAEVSFDLQEKDGSTHVTWGLNSKLPFFMFWMINKMKVFIGMDYERGLKMLKEYLETGVVASKININGITTFEPQQYIGIARECSIEEMSSVMSDNFKKLYDFIQDNNLDLKAAPFTIYNTFDIFKQRSNFISAIPVESHINTSSPFISGEIKGGKGLKVTHIGSYQNLGNAWATAISYARNKKIKTQKSPMGIEYYLNDPMETLPEELITEVIVPLK